MAYDTTSSLNSFVWRKSLENIVPSLLLTVAMIIPAMAGESLRMEVRKEAKEASFLHFIYSSFFTRRVASLILIGYFVALIMFGLQSSLFELGRNTFGVWNEQSWQSQFMTSHFPFLTALVHSLKSSLLEEFLYRLFAIHFFLKIFKRPSIAIVLSALLWGFAHTNYPIFSHVVPGIGNDDHLVFLWA